MTGMLIGVAALSAWGFYRFNRSSRSWRPSSAPTPACWSAVLAQATLYRKAFAEMYGEIFMATVVICVVGACWAC